MAVIIHFPTITQGNESITDANATSKDLLLNKIAYNNDGKIIGEIETVSGLEFIPSLEDQLLPQKYLKGNNTIKGDSNLIPANIRKGIKIFNVIGTLEPNTPVTSEIDILNCNGLNSSTLVYNKYKDVIMTSNDGDLTTFNTLTDYVYENISADYQNETAGINFKCKNNNTNFYFKLPINITTSHCLFKLVYYVSTWINPTIKFNLLTADSVDDIPNKIKNSDFVCTKTILLPAASNNTNVFLEYTDLPIGEYYVSISIPNATGGNHAILNYLGLLFL